jgi:hypothetical protein
MLYLHHSSLNQPYLEIQPYCFLLQHCTLASSVAAVVHCSSKRTLAEAPTAKTAKTAKIFIAIFIANGYDDRFWDDLGAKQSTYGISRPRVKQQSFFGA